MIKEELIDWINLHLPTTRHQELKEILRDESFTSILLKEMGEVFFEHENHTTHALEEWFWTAWPGLSSFTQQEQAILKYYFPLSRLLRTVIQKSHCLTTIFGLQVCLREIGISYDYEKSSNDLIEGEYLEEYAASFQNTEKKQFCIEVGPIEVTLLPDWMPGGGKRAFLKNGILPILLPANSVTEINVISSNCIAHEFTAETPVYWEQNFQPV